MGNKPSKILLVEDNLDDVHLLRRTLAQAGAPQFNLVQVERLSEALNRLSEEDFDMVLLDLSLPDSQGLATFVRVYAQAPGVPIVVLSGFHDEALAVKAVHEGAQDYLIKGQVGGDLLVCAMRYAIEHKQAEEVLTMQARVLENMQEGVQMASEKDGIIFLTNPAFDAMFGYERGELIGKHVSILNSGPPEEAAQVASEIMEQLRTKGAWFGELRNQKKDGTLFPTSARVSALEMSGKRYWVTVQGDITERKQAEKALQESQESLLRAEKMAALGQLAAGIAHEMNTPLGASLTSLKLIQGLVEEYQKSIGDPEVGERDHQDIAAEMDRLASDTQQWMEKAASYIRSLKLHTRDLKRGEERAFSVLQVIEDAGLLLSHHLRLSQCTLNISCTSSEPTLHGDPGKLGQVLTNLVVNAIDAYKDAGKEGREINVEIAEDGEVLEIRVKDQGCGIPGENKEKIFDELYSTKPLGEGTGLGLSIARNIVSNLFGGTIRLESQVGQGSTFILRLPRYSFPSHSANARGV